jgi:hypothetical protein
MSPKKNKILKTQKQKNEKAYEYGARMINTYNEPLTVDMALARNNLRFWKPTRSQMQSALHDAVRKGLATKFRDAHYKRVVYAKLNTLPHSDQHALAQDDEFFDDAKLEEILYKPSNFKKEVKLHGRKITQYRFTARQFLDQLHEANRRLYEQALDAVEGSISSISSIPNSGWFTNADGHMCIEVIE